MADQSSGNNLIPGLDMKNIYDRDLDLLKSFGSQIGSAYDQYGKGLRSALGQDQDDFAEQFLAGKLLSQRQGKDYTVLGVTYDGKTHRPKGAPEGGYSLSADGKMTAHTPVKKTETEITETLTPNPPAPVYNAKERVKKHGVKKAEDMAMMEWAKAHKGLAEKVKPGQAGYDAIQLALGKTTVEPEDIRGFMDDSGKSAEEARAILGGGFVETVIDGDKPMVTTINPAAAQGGSEVEIPTGNFSEMSQSMQDLVAPSLEAGAAFNINVDNVMNQDDPQAFLMEQLKKIPGINRMNGVIPNVKNYLQ